MDDSRDARLVGDDAAHARPDLEQPVRGQHEDGLPVELDVELPHGDRDEPPGGPAAREPEGAAGPQRAGEEGRLLADADPALGVARARAEVRAREGDVVEGCGRRGLDPARRLFPLLQLYDFHNIVRRNIHGPLTRCRRLPARWLAPCCCAV